MRKRAFQIGQSMTKPETRLRERCLFIHHPTNGRMGQIARDVLYKRTRVKHTRTHGTIPQLEWEMFEILLLHLRVCEVICSPSSLKAQVILPGTAIWIFGVVPNTIQDATTIINVSFTLDKATPQSYFHSPDTSDTYLYSVPIYNKNKVLRMLSTSFS
jgi:hypothetical protein